ncbi:MAG: VWA domain-containing protein [Polyangiaceae bacterium]
MGAFEFLNPKGLWLLTGLVPLVLLYVLKIRRSRVRVGSTWLWAEARRDLLARHPFRRLVPEIPLLLQVLALVLLALALARPARRGGAVEGDHVAIVIDTSASMGSTATLGAAGGTRLDEAKEAAIRVVRAMGTGADALVLEASKEPRLALPPTRDKRRVVEVLESLAPTDVEGNLAAAVSLAADRVRALGGKQRIVVVTDGSLEGEAPIFAANVPVDVVRVGRDGDNAGIVRIDARSGVNATNHHEELQIFVMVRNYADRPRDAYLTARLENATTPVASRRVLLPKSDKAPVVLTFEPSALDRGKGIVVELAGGDALKADDVAFARVPPAAKMPVTLASRASYSWFTRALDSDPTVDLQRLSLEELAKVNVDPDALVLVEGACPDAFPGKDVVVVAPPKGTCLGLEIGNAVEQPELTSWESGDPRFRFLTLDGVHVAKANAIAAPGSGVSLVRAGKTTIVADASLPGRAATILGFDVGDSDWPLKASFVLFVRNLVEWGKLHRSQGTTGPTRTGEPLRVAVPPGTPTVSVALGDGKPKDVEAKGSYAVLPPPSRAGLYHVEWTSPRVGKITIPANLTSDREGDIRVRDVRTTEGSSGAVSVVRPDDRHTDVSPWLALAAAVFLGLDVLWLTKPWTRSTKRSASKSGKVRGALVALATAGLVPLAYVVLVRFGVVRETYVRFERPLAVLGLAVALPTLAWLLGNLPGHMSPSRRALVVATSAAAVTAAFLAFAGPELGRPQDRLSIVIAVDRSRSIELVPGAEKRMAAELTLVERGMRPDDRVGTVAFAAEAATEDPLRPKSELPPAQKVSLGREATDVEAAIRRALAELPPDSAARVVLVTDGVQNRGDAIAGASMAVAAEVPVDAVLLEQSTLPNVRVESVRGPLRVSEGEPMDIRVVTNSAQAADVDVRVKRDGELIRSGKARVGAGEDVLRIREIATDGGFHRYDVELTAVDPKVDVTADDNVGSAFVRVRGPSMALVLEGDAGKSAPLAKALRTNGFLVDERGATAVPTDIGGLAGFDLVVLSDVRASDMTGSQLDAIASYVRDLGGGLLLFGGDRSMGPGGFARTPIEDVSPVSFDLREEKRRASLAEVIAIDYSGSMGATVSGHTKLELANEAAARSASLLGSGDRLGVEHVDTVVAWTVPLSPVSDVNAIGARIRKVGVGGGGIYTDIALDAAYAALRMETVNLKHTLLFADGADAEQMTGCRAKVSSALGDGITTSVISLGRGSDSPELEALARLGGGRFYLIDDATKLPAVFTQETILATKSALVEKAFPISIGAPGPATRGIDFAGAPDLQGYVVSIPKPRATVLLGGPENDPILATWSVGLGHAGAFTSDYKDRWGRDWLRFPGAAKMFGQLGRDLARKADDPRVRLEADAKAGELHVRADVIGDDGRSQSFRRLMVHVAGPDGFSRNVTLDAVGAGRYAAHVPLARPGAYIATAKDEVTGDSVGTTGAVLSVGDELRAGGSDRALLARVANLTGGKLRDTLAGVFDDRGVRKFAYSSLSALVNLLAGLLLLAAVASRRLSVPEGVVRALVRVKDTFVENAAAKGARLEKERLTREMHARDQERAHLALQRRKHETQAKLPERPGNMPGGLLGTAADAPSPVHSAPTAPRGQSSASNAENPAPPEAPKLTAAELLAMRRRKK